MEHGDGCREAWLRYADSHADESVGISDGRLAHMLGVAREAEEVARDSGMGTDECRDMFALGLVHDIGYEFGSAENHPKIGAALLKENGFRHWGEVCWHGDPLAPCWTKELAILNIADMRIGPSGQHMSMSERVDDISSRYGADSVQARDAMDMVDVLESVVGPLGISDRWLD